MCCRSKRNISYYIWTGKGIEFGKTILYYLIIIIINTMWHREGNVKQSGCHWIFSVSDWDRYLEERRGEGDTPTAPSGRRDWEDNSIRKHSTTERQIWHHKSLGTLQQEDLNIPMQMKKKRRTLNTTLWRWYRPSHRKWENPYKV